MLRFASGLRSRLPQTRLSVRWLSTASPSSPTFTGKVPPQNQFDLIVLGSGPAAQKAAVNASKLKKRVAVIDTKQMLGGVCVHTGTIPSKTFREAVLFLTGYRQRGFYGQGFLQTPNICASDILERVRKVEVWETDTVKAQLQRNRVSLFYGKGRFLDPHHVEVFSDDDRCASDSVLRADNILVAVGSRPAHNKLYDFSHPLIFDSDSILQRKRWEVPRELIVVGTGVIAIEYASMFSALPGSRVTVIDERPTFLDFVDREVVEALRHIMRQSQTTFRLGEKVVKVEPSSDSVTVQLESGKRVKGDAVLYAVGRQGNTDTLNLEAVPGVEANNRGLIKVNQNFQTGVPHIYAAGDVIGFPALASTSMEQGRLASQHMFDTPKHTASPFFPYGIYTIPEISVIGKSEQQLTAEKIPYEIGIAKFHETGKGAMLGLGHDAGFLKLLFDPVSHTLLGAHCIGENASEIIHIAQVVLHMGGTIEYFRDNVFNYPTFAEAYRMAALDGLNRCR